MSSRGAAHKVKLRISATALSALALGAVAFGTAALGALAVGAITVRKLKILDGLEGQRRSADELALGPASVVPSDAPSDRFGLADTEVCGVQK